MEVLGVNQSINFNTSGSTHTFTPPAGTTHVLLLAVDSVTYGTSTLQVSVLRAGNGDSDPVLPGIAGISAGSAGAAGEGGAWLHPFAGDGSTSQSYRLQLRNTSNTHQLVAIYLSNPDLIGTRAGNSNTNLQTFEHTPREGAHSLIICAVFDNSGTPATRTEVSGPAALMSFSGGGTRSFSGFVWETQSEAIEATFSANDALLWIEVMFTRAISAPAQAWPR